MSKKTKKTFMDKAMLGKIRPDKLVKAFDKQLEKFRNGQTRARHLGEHVGMTQVEYGIWADARVTGNDADALKHIVRRRRMQSQITIPPWSPMWSRYLETNAKTELDRLELANEDRKWTEHRKAARLPKPEPMPQPKQERGGALDGLSKRVKGVNYGFTDWKDEPKAADRPVQIIVRYGEIEVSETLRCFGDLEKFVVSDGFFAGRGISHENVQKIAQLALRAAMQELVMQENVTPVVAPALRAIFLRKLCSAEVVNFAPTDLSAASAAEAS